ncbi:EutN/CcmL family microcompartment protein [Singulisphaera acidiphila]|uniref:Carbon dioxide concentrating mechanism/carboxysome shell protein n=1 Tax=Singulisphaera acidiphila (strain ATCC BAA-1392 / DSM 18658 / VKM B-2454 / MOB10) TaxID=886293 RepID=L0DA62_SINAD|nr:EutN/CcmL family microcompartment protein [Singulisphaera acidiphila]AGA26137.1 carbon dioxide concentrating mechanism/carboxysome shell protein [Singulisphaera acidiphila DSM 18658]
MRIAEVIGRVTLSRSHPSLRGARFVLALPMPLEALTEDSDKRGEDVVVYDDLGAGPGSLIGLSEGREAANPFGKVKIPVDAYCACLLDRLSF